MALQRVNNAFVRHFSTGQTSHLLIHQNLDVCTRQYTRLAHNRLAIRINQYASTKLTVSNRFFSTKNPNSLRVVQPGLNRVKRWWYRLKPWREEIENFKRLISLATKQELSTAHGDLRYFVSFPMLSGKEFSNWFTVTDSWFGTGYSRAEFIRSPRQASGSTPLLAPPNIDPTDGSLLYLDNSASSTAAIDPNALKSEFAKAENSKIPLTNPFSYTFPAKRTTLSVDPETDKAREISLLNSLPEYTRAGCGLFRGFLSTKKRRRGDVAQSGIAALTSPELTTFGMLRPFRMETFTHLIIRFRGDGRSYYINFLSNTIWSDLEHDVFRYMLFTRGGPYWQMAKIPLSKFYTVTKGQMNISRQSAMPQTGLRVMNISLADRIDGPFSLEIDYIGFWKEYGHVETFAYEKYDGRGAL